MFCGCDGDVVLVSSVIAWVIQHITTDDGSFPNYFNVHCFINSNSLIVFECIEL